MEDPGTQERSNAAAWVSSDDEEEYYRQAVGEDPDEGDACLLVVFLFCPGIR